MGVSTSSRHLCCLALAMAGAYALLIAPSAVARDAYVANYGSDNVSVIDTQTNQVIGSPITSAPAQKGSRSPLTAGVLTSPTTNRTTSR